MRLNVDQIYPLLLLLPITAMLLYPFIKYAKKNMRQKLFLTLRSLAALLIILSMCSVSIVKSAKDTTTIFLADLSDSTADRQTAIENFIKDALKYKGAHDITAVVSFGANSATENEPSKQTIFNGFQTAIDQNFTNIQSALIHATALFPPNSKKRIVLLTDGLENAGDSERQIRALMQNDTLVEVYRIIRNDFKEVQLTEVMTPEKAGKNQIIDIAAHIESNVKTKATLLLYAENDIKYKEVVSLDVGTNKFIFTDTISSGGVLTYRVEIIPEEDTYMENNSLSSFVTVNDRPVVLLIQDEEMPGEQLIKILEDTVELEVRLPEEAPQTFESLIKYDAFILADVSIERFNEQFLINLESVVKNQGKGLLVTGGDSSYGPGGYYQTLLEEMLPVNIDVKPKEEKPNLALMLVIDKSGSMTGGQYGITKLELAKEAAIRSTEVLEAKDMLGVIAFDDTVKWPVELQYAKDKGALQDMIATIVPGGGTTIQPSLQAAVTAIKAANTKLKHIILLTDGQAETTGYASIIKEMQENDITLSTVAVGEGSDRALLQTLATGGGGRYYMTDEFSDIPSIFTKEAFMAGKKYLNNITFSPTLVNWSQVMKGIDAVPELDGYVATSMKATSKLLLAGPENDPILASWQYGLGRSVAWTSDANGLWTSKWMSWEQSPGFWTNLISWVVQQDLDKKYTAETAYIAGQGVITVKSIGKETLSAPEISGVLVTPKGLEEQITLEATAPGTYTGTFPAAGEGVYMVNLLLQAEEATEKIVTGLNVGYSPEYDFYSNSGILPERIAQVSGGRVLSKARDVFKGEVPPVVGSHNISNLMLILGLLIFMSEIILRKTHINLAWLSRWMVQIQQQTAKIVHKVKIPKKIPATTATTTAATTEKLTSPTTPSKPKPKEVKVKKETTTDSQHLDVLLNKKRKREL